MPRSDRGGPKVTATLTELLYESAGTWPERVAVSDGADERAITYRDLNVLVGDLAAELNRRGGGRGGSVAIVADNCIEYVLALFAMVAAGACAAPLNPQLAAGELDSRLGQVGARAVVVPAHLYDDFAGLGDHGTSPVWKLALTQGSQGKERPLTAELIGEPLSNHGAGPAKTGEVSQSRADDVALLLLTSGTTAAP